MSLIICPECGIKISDKALICPHCGFHSADSLRPISEQDKYEIVPVFEYEIAEWKPNRDDLSVISYEDNKSLVQYFGNWNTIKLKLPAIAEVIEEMATKDHILVAKMDSYVKKLIADGTYRFSVDKNGELLPTIRDAKGIVKQVRLEDMTFSPNVVQSLNNLSIHAAMAQILDEIESIGDSIREVHIELQNDRLALAESARDKLMQARRIQDAQLRATAMLGAISSATDAKRSLMRNFTQNLHQIVEHSKKSDLELMIDRKGEKEISQKAIDSFQALIYLTNAVQAECEGYAMLGEYESCKECLEEFKSFVLDNRLNQRDTLLLLNENSAQKKINVVNEFSDIASRITAFDPDRFLTTTPTELFLNGTVEGEADDESQYE